MSKQVKGVSEKIEACAKKEFLRKDMWMHRSERSQRKRIQRQVRFIRVTVEFTEKFVSVQERFDATDPDKQAKQGEVTALIGPSFWMKQRRLWM